MGAVRAHSPFERILRIAAVALAALFAIMAASAPAAQPKRIIAVGDLHGGHGQAIAAADRLGGAQRQGDHVPGGDGLRLVSHGA